MSDTLIFTVAVVAFVLMAVGLVLTVIEFYAGQPKREQDDPRGTPPEPRSILR